MNTTYQDSLRVIAELRARIDELEIESIRASTWAANSQVALATLQSCVRGFASGVHSSPYAINRVIGFRPEYEAMLEAGQQPLPPLMPLEVATKFHAERKAKAGAQLATILEEAPSSTTDVT
jgi:hypothetical protein